MSGGAEVELSRYDMRLKLLEAGLELDVTDDKDDRKALRQDICALRKAIKAIDKALLADGIEPFDLARDCAVN